MTQTDVLTQEKERKLKEIKELNINPYPYSYNKTHDSLEIKTKFNSLKPEESKCCRKNYDSKKNGESYIYAYTG